MGKLKKHVCMALALGMAVTSLTGCGEKPKGADGSTAGSSKENAAGTGAVQEDFQVAYPVKEEGAKLKIWCEIHSSALQFATNYSENIAYQKVMENTGIEIEFIHPSPGQEQEQFNTMIASGEWPDIIIGGGRYKGGIQQGVEDGVYLDLTPYMETYAPDYYAIANYNDDIRRELTTENGSYYAMYATRHPEDPVPAPWFRPNVRKDWLDEFNMEVPQTLDEVEAYFEAIRANKGEDVLCVVFPKQGSWTDEIFYQAYDLYPGFYVVDGKVTHGNIEPKLKDYVSRMNSWYEKGYISKDFLSYDESQVAGLFQTGKIGMFLDSVDVAYIRASEAGVEAISTPYFRLNRGDKLHTGPRAGYNEGQDAVISTDCKNPELALQFLNYAFTEEGAMLYNYGVEGVTYTMENGEPVFTQEMVNPEDMTTEAANYLKRIHFATKRTVSDTVLWKNTWAPEQLGYRERWADDPDVDGSYRLPPIKFTNEENARLAEIMVDFDTFSDEMIFKFIMGKEPLDNFDAYLEKCKDYHIEEAIAIYQAAYDRYMAN